MPDKSLNNNRNIGNEECPPWPQAFSLPEIVVNGRHMRDVTADAKDALLEANKPEKMFQRKGKLVRVRNDDNGLAFIEEMGESSLRGLLARCCNFMKITDKDTATPVPPPLYVVRDILSLVNWKVPRIFGIVECPQLRADGTILSKPGYDIQTGLYYSPSLDLTFMPAISDNPTTDEVKLATEILSEPLLDFPFDSDSSRANAIGIMLTSPLRAMISGLVPLGILDKPQHGTGASLLAEVMNTVATGRSGAMTAAPSTDDEWEKRITSILLRGQQIAIIDNIEAKLWSHNLAMLLTSTEFQGRILGKSEMPNLNNRVTWLVTGNNVNLGGDLARRCIWVHIDSGLERPWLRPPSTFKHPDLKRWILDNRGSIIASILTVARAWILAGKPYSKDTLVLGGFENYCRIIGGILNFVGIKGFLANAKSMHDELDMDTTQWKRFFSVWHEHIGEVSLTAAKLTQYINNSDELRGALPDFLADTDNKNYSVKLGQQLAKKKDAIYHDDKKRFKLIKDSTRQRAVCWKVVISENITSLDFPTDGEVSEVPSFQIYNKEDNKDTEKVNIDDNKLLEKETANTSQNLTSGMKTGEVNREYLKPVSEFEENEYYLIADKEVSTVKISPDAKFHGTCNRCEIEFVPSTHLIPKLEFESCPSCGGSIVVQLISGSKQIVTPFITITNILGN